MVAGTSDVVWPSERVRGFLAHLRANGYPLGPAETAAAAAYLARLGVPDEMRARLGLRVLLSGNRAEWEGFDDLFDAYWHARGLRVVEPSGATTERRPAMWDRVLPPDANATFGAVPKPGEAGEAAQTRARLVASERELMRRTDLRSFHDGATIAEAERVAEALARALRYRLSRRRRAASKGRAIDLRRTIRRNMSRGAEPLELVHRRRPDRPVEIVVLLDVSGSMKLYSRYFLLFVRGLLCRWLRADAYLFHTRLARVTDVLRESDSLKALTRLSLMAEGFGGGTQIARCLRIFNQRYAKQALNSRSVVIVMSDGYDSDPPEALAAELKRLKTRARRLIWLNPLLGWRDYQPVARGMAAALPHIDHFAAAGTLDDLAALEDELARL